MSPLKMYDLLSSAQQIKSVFFSFHTMKISGDLLYVVLDPIGFDCMDENSHTVLERYESK